MTTPVAGDANLTDDSGAARVRLEPSSVDAWNALSHVNEWVRFADTKAAGALAADGFIGGTLLSYFGSEAGARAYWPVVLLGIATAITTLTSATCCLLCLVPRLKAGRPAPHLYFRCIAEYRTPDEYREGLLQMLHDGELLRELSDELWSRSVAATLKYKFATYGLQLLAATLAIGSLLGLVLLISG
jgi:hypothetical protein